MGAVAGVYAAEVTVAGAQPWRECGIAPQLRHKEFSCFDSNQGMIHWDIRPIGLEIVCDDARKRCGSMSRAVGLKHRSEGGARELGQAMSTKSPRVGGHALRAGDHSRSAQSSTV
jgi:hypothetical protein